MAKGRKTKGSERNYLSWMQNYICWFAPFHVLNLLFTYQCFLFVHTLSENKVTVDLNMILFKGKYFRYKGRAIVNKYETCETMIVQNNLLYKMTSAMVDSLTVKADHSCH